MLLVTGVSRQRGIGFAIARRLGQRIAVPQVQGLESLCLTGPEGTQGSWFFSFFLERVIGTGEEDGTMVAALDVNLGI